MKQLLYNNGKPTRDMDVLANIKKIDSEMITIGIIILVLIPFLIWKPKQTIIVGGGLLTVLTFIFFIIPRFYHNDLTLIEKISNPSDNCSYCLYKNGDWLSDPDFKVYKIDFNTNPDSFDNINQMGSFKELLSNYEEHSDFTKKPDLKLIDNRFLVLSRGGYNFGLYDLKLKKDTFNNCCPFSSWASQNIWAEKGTYYEGTIQKDEKSDYGIWIKNNIHNPINNYIQENRSK